MHIYSLFSWKEFDPIIHPCHEFNFSPVNLHINMYNSNFRWYGINLPPNFLIFFKKMGIFVVKYVVW